MTTRRLVAGLAALVVLALFLIVGVVAYIDPSDPDEPEGRSSSPQVWDEDDVVDHIGLRRSGSNWSFTAATGTQCDVAVILTSSGQVQLYKNAGDVVATNPDETAGVKIVGSSKRTCLEAATASLENLD